MPIERNQLEALLQQYFPDAEIVLEDLAGDDDHWSVTVTSPAFAGKNRLAQHRMVQEAVAGYDIHALAIKTRTPEDNND